MTDYREDHDLLIRISVQLDQINAQVGSFSENFGRLETKMEEVKHRGLIQQTEIERQGEKISAIEGDIEGDKGMKKRLEALEQERLVWKTQFRTMIIILSPIYGLIVIQVTRWVTSLIWGTP